MYYRCKYYDGKSSGSHEVKVGYFPAERRIYLQKEDEFNRAWNIEECNFDLVYKTLTVKKADSEEQLVIQQPELIYALNEFRHQSRKTKFYDRLVHAGKGIHVVLVLFILAAILAINFWALPAVAERSVFLIPKSYDQAIGAAFWDQFVDEEEVHVEKTDLVNSFLDELKLPEGKYFHVTVVNSESVNAFALPNGEIVIYTGIIDKMESHEELVALLGHEIAHVTNRHSVKMMCRNLASYLFIAAVFSDVNSIMTVIVDNASQLQNLSFSRELEHEADADGIEFMIVNEVNPQGMALMFSRLNSEVEGFIPEFLSSHPVTDDRIQFAEEKASTVQAESFIDRSILVELFEALIEE